MLGTVCGRCIFQRMAESFALGGVCHVDGVGEALSR